MLWYLRYVTFLKINMYLFIYYYASRNAKGQPIEHGDTKLISYLGSIVQSNVPIMCDN